MTKKQERAVDNAHKFYRDAERSGKSYEEAKQIGLNRLHWELYGQVSIGSGIAQRFVSA